MATPVWARPPRGEAVVRLPTTGVVALATGAVGCSWGWPGTVGLALGSALGLPLPGAVGTALVGAGAEVG